MKMSSKVVHGGEQQTSCPSGQCKRHCIEGYSKRVYRHQICVVVELDLWSGTRNGEKYVEL